MVLFYLPQSGTHKVGFTATKKLGNAVKRNRAKRRMRAMFCEYSHSLKDGIYIFVAKAAIYDLSHNQFQQDFQKVLSRAKAIA